jgi:hypothetical protein
VQTKIQSLTETTVQVMSDLGINVLIASPLAYLLYNINSQVIVELIVIMTIINYGKSYAIRRYYNEESKRHKPKKAV